MTQKDVSFRSKDNVSTIYGHLWLPDEKPIALLQMLHGMQEHIGRYDEFATWLCGKGFAVAGHDHIFHGKSASSIERLGHATTKNPHEIMMEDTFSFYNMLEEEFSDIPHFILGHSMGSYILRMMLCEKARETERLAGAVIVGTGSEKQFKVVMGKLIVRLIAAVKGRDSYSPFIQSVSFGKPYQQYDMTGKDLNNNWCSKNVENLMKTAEDPYCSFPFSVGAMMTLAGSTCYDNRLSNIKKMKKDLPVLFASGSDDPVGNMGKGVEEAYQKFLAAGLENVAIKLYEGDRHEILNELDREQVYSDIYDWMTAQMKS